MLETTTTVQQRSLAAEPRILDRFADDLHKAGLVGEERAAKLLYLVLTSRLLERPISAVVKAPSAAGKSYLVDTVLRFFPPSAFYTVTGMSERALVYSEEPLAHRTIVIYEAAGMASDGFAPYFLRTLLSEGHIRYETVETPKQGKPKGVVLEREGPTGAVLTTTRVKLDPELETRLLSITITDSAAQTKAVMYALADDRGEAEIDLLWPALQEVLRDEVLERGCGVTIPFARDLADAIPPVATRLRRDFGAILALIRTHALLHRATRERDENGNTIATIEDYAVVRGLVADLVSEGVGRTVSPETRETVQAVAGLAPHHQDGVRQTALAAALELDKGTVSRRVRKALDGGHLRNLEDHRGRPHRLVPGDPLPEEQVILPEPEELRGCTVAETPPPSVGGKPTEDPSRELIWDFTGSPDIAERVGCATHRDDHVPAAATAKPAARRPRKRRWPRSSPPRFRASRSPFPRPLQASAAASTISTRTSAPR